MSMPDGLTPGGLAFLVTAWTVITGLVVFCFWRILGRRSGGDEDR